MCKQLYLLPILVCHVVIGGISQEYEFDQDYVSIESGEQPSRNEVFGSASEDYSDRRSDEVEATEPKPTEPTKLTKPVNKTKVVVSTTEKTILPLVNLTSSTIKCTDLKTSESSEENRCKSTLVNYPYAVSIQKKGAHYATGALINKQAIITVAGEFYYVRESIKLFRVRLGSVDCKKEGIVVPIKTIDVHPSFVPGKPSFDLALLKLASEVNLTEFIRPIPLSKVKQKVISAKFLTTYWPRLIVGGKILSKTAKERVKQHSMRVSTQKLIPWKSCQTMMKARNAVLDETSLCLKPLATHHSVCMPDAGAPVVAEDGLWGITSGWTSEECTLYPSPTIFTRIALKPVRYWLENTL